MDCLAIMDSGNYVFYLSRILQEKGYTFEVTATPCQIAKNGCGYCLRFPESYLNIVIEEGRAKGVKIREVYKIIPLFSRNKYEKVIFN